MFYKNIIINSAVRIKAFLSCYSMGLGGGKIVENFDPALFDKVRIRNAKERIPNDILGLKMRLGHKLKAGIENLQAAVDIANEIEGMAVCVHVTDSPDSLEKVVKILRKGDIMCHCFHGTGNTILDENGKIFDAVWEARERGVYFDQCNGKFNFSIDVSNAALAQGFLPDVISTDMGSDKLNYSPNVRSLPYVMSKYLSCGISLYDVIERTTQTPAKLMHMEGRIGTLAPGAFADVSIFTIEKRRVVHFDTFQKPFVGEHLMVPMMTVTGGQLAYAQAGFNLRETPVTD
jgi:predicted amidohydrolase